MGGDGEATWPTREAIGKSARPIARIKAGASGAFIETDLKQFRPGQQSFSSLRELGILFRRRNHRESRGHARETQASRQAEAAGFPEQFFSRRYFFSLSTFVSCEATAIHLPFFFSKTSVPRKSPEKSLPSSVPLIFNIAVTTATLSPIIRHL